MIKLHCCLFTDHFPSNCLSLVPTPNELNFLFSTIYHLQGTPNCRVTIICWIPKNILLFKSTSKKYNQLEFDYLKACLSRLGIATILTGYHADDTCSKLLTHWANWRPFHKVFSFIFRAWLFCQQRCQKRRKEKVI